MSIARRLQGIYCIYRGGAAQERCRSTIWKVLIVPRCGDDTLAVVRPCWEPDTPKVWWCVSRVRVMAQRTTLRPSLTHYRKLHPIRPHMLIRRIPSRVNPPSYTSSVVVLSRPDSVIWEAYHTLAPRMFSLPESDRFPPLDGQIPSPLSVQSKYWFSLFVWIVCITDSELVGVVGFSARTRCCLIQCQCGTWSTIIASLSFEILDSLSSSSSIFLEWCSGISKAKLHFLQKPPKCLH